MKKILFIIDAQNDFCSKGGSLLCENADNAISNICELLKTKKFDEVISHKLNFTNTVEL